MMYLYFYLISISLIGYGNLLSKYLNIKSNCFGLSGLLGITFLALVSYSTTLFLKHNAIFNLIIISIGLIYFLVNIKKFKNFKKEFLIHFLFFFLLFIFITVSKNHDDFPYYHFPYMSILTEFAHPIGLGQFNNGFRSPSSIFFLGSLLYLTIKNIYLFHLVPAFVLGFANILLFKMIIDKINFNYFRFSNFLALLSFCFINIFFYRLAEHGTDRSGMILSLIAIIYLFQLINNNNISSKNDIFYNLKLFAIIICFLFSIKPFYLIYFSFFIIIFSYKITRQTFIDLLFSKTFFYCLSFIFFTIFFTFINSGCLIFPLQQTCFENFNWTISKEHVAGVKIWFELWSKAGATPTNLVEDRNLYISNFNWVSNWIVAYFFNKMSDFLLGLTLLSLIIFISFYRNKLSVNNKSISYKAIYSILLLFLIEWFMNHPTLRYGGYNVIALIFFIPMCLYLQKLQIEYESFLKISTILILISLVVFVGRNFSRLDKELNLYKYEPLKNSNFHFIGGDEDFYFRYNMKINKNLSNYPRINILELN